MTPDGPVPRKAAPATIHTLVTSSSQFLRGVERKSSLRKDLNRKLIAVNGRWCGTSRKLSP